MHVNKRFISVVEMLISYDHNDNLVPRVFTMITSEQNQWSFVIVSELMH